MSDWSQPKLTMLREILVERFSEEELKTLCFDLGGVTYDSLPGEGTSGKARELISHCDRRKSLQCLVNVGKRLRPDIAWDKLLLHITVDTTILINAFRKRQILWDAVIMGLIADTCVSRGPYLRVCLDVKGWIRKEYFDSLDNDREFQRWYSEIAGNIEFVETQEPPQSAAILPICDDVDRTVIAVAYQTDRILLTDDPNMGKGTAEDNPPNLQALAYLERTLGLQVCNADEARSLLR